MQDKSYNQEKQENKKMSPLRRLVSSNNTRLLTGYWRNVDCINAPEEYSARTRQLKIAAGLDQELTVNNMQDCQLALYFMAMSIYAAHREIDHNHQESLDRVEYILKP